MAQRMIEMHRVLKPTGSLYLHCDPTASHYLKIILDRIFGKENFRNEIVWSYDGPQRPSKKIFKTKHGVILRYSKTDKYYSNPKGIAPFQPIEGDELKRYKTLKDGRKYYTTPKGDYTDVSIQRLDKESRIDWGKNGKARVRHFLIQDGGVYGRNKQLHDVWTDINSLGHRWR